MLKALDAVDRVKFEQPALLSMVKKKPADYEGALRRVLEIKATRGSEAAEDALRYAIFLSDVRSLYDVALGMYDFSLVLLVAQQSQMVASFPFAASGLESVLIRPVLSFLQDPKEYLPFLASMQKHEGPYQRFIIDDHLKKYSKAVAHLAGAGVLLIRWFLSPPPIDESPKQDQIILNIFCSTWRTTGSMLSRQHYIQRPTIATK
jgi:elongator complex protein 1